MIICIVQFQVGLIRYTKTDLVFGFSKKPNLGCSYPRTGKRRGLSPDKKRRGLYSGKMVFGLLPKTILR